MGEKSKNGNFEDNSLKVPALIHYNTKIGTLTRQYLQPVSEKLSSCVCDKNDFIFCCFFSPNEKYLAYLV